MSEAYPYSSLPVSSGIYFIQNIESQKLYIGSAVRIKKRVYRHFKDLRAQRHHSNHLQKSFNKHGFSKFRFGVIEICPVSDLHAKEQWWINFYNSAKSGFNCASRVVFNEFINTELCKKRISEGIKRSWQDPLRIQRSKDAMAIVMNSEEYRHKKRLEMLERWKANPEKMKVGLAFCHSEAGTKRRVESVRKTFSSKEWKEYKSANMKEVWRRPGFREKIKLASASFFSDPVKKKKRIENLISPKNRMKARMTVYARNFCKLKEKGECSTPLEFSNLLFSLNEAGKSPNAISKMFGIGFKAAKLWIKYRQIVPTTMVV